MNGFILDDAQGVSGRFWSAHDPAVLPTHTSKYVVEDKVAEKIDHSLFEVHNVLETVPDLSMESQRGRIGGFSEICYLLWTGHDHTRIIRNLLTGPSRIVDEIRDHRDNAHTAQHGDDALVSLSKLGIGILSDVVSDSDGYTKESLASAPSFGKGETYEDAE